MRTTKYFLSSTLVLCTSLLACGGGGDDDNNAITCEGDKCDLLDSPDSEIEDSPCDGILVDKSGRSGNFKVAGRLEDPVAKFVFRTGDDCPANFQDILTKLRANDTEDCPADQVGAGMSSRVVTETAQLLDTPTDYRLVTSRDCGGRGDHAVLFSSFGVPADTTELPRSVEIIALDEARGVFNYYEAVSSNGGKTVINFFGNSNDMLKGPASGDVRRCATCHVGGGLVMKELESPWVHWEGDTDTPGASELISRFPEIGNQSDGIVMEQIVRAGNKVWLPKRVDFLKANGTVKDLLTPLFCTPEINIAEMSLSKFSPGGDPSIGGGLKSESVLSPRVKSLAKLFSFTVSDEVYGDQIRENGQQMCLAMSGSGCEPFEPAAIDTKFPGAFIKRAAIDDDYVKQLITAGLIDQEFVDDVMTVDISRAVFSDDRCDLLQFAPDIKTADMNATSVKEGFIENLGSPESDTPAAELLANLQATGGHDVLAGKFATACKALSETDRAKNVLSIMSLNRDLARQLPIMEFAPTLPFDELGVAEGTRLDPNTCLLTDKFTAIQR